MWLCKSRCQKEFYAFKLYICKTGFMSLQKSAKQTERSNSYTVVRLKGCKTVKIFDYCKRSFRWSYVSLSC